MNLEVRRAVLEDAPAIGRIQLGGWQHAYKAFMAPEVLARQRVEGFEALAVQAIQSATREVFVARLASERVVGFCAIHHRLIAEPPEPTVGQIADLYVDTPLVGRGIGSALLDAAIAMLIELGRRSVALWTFACNMRAINFYSRHGFVFDGGSQDHSTGARLVRMRRSLSPVA
jgi:ribosomal protein S18 acetylase RimI-like enzyme